MIDFGFRPSKLCGVVDKPSLSDCSPLGQSMPVPGQIVLTKYLEKATGHAAEPRDQLNSPSCVGQSTANAVDILMGVQIGALGLPLQWHAKACAESIYALSRYEISFKKYGRRMRGGGSEVHFAAQAVKEYGTLAMLAYPEIDLTEFSVDRCAEWGDDGLPDELESIARHSIIKAFTPVKNVEEAIAAMECGSPVIIGADIGFKNQVERDSDGFLKPDGSWLHAQVFIGYDTEYRRPGLALWNSWGTRWLRNSNARNGIPEGAYYIDLDTADDMIKRGDACAVTQFSGFGDLQPLNFKLI